MKQYNVIDALLDYSDTSLQYCREVSCFAVPSCGVISSTTNNNAGGVEFDWFSIKDKIWQLKEQNEAPEVAYMLHTHPPYYNKMSGTDRNMVYGWCMALGIPIWFLVLTEDEIATYICSLNQETKKVERDLVDLSQQQDIYMELRLIAEIMYGMSKANTLDNDVLKNVFDGVNSSTINWNNIHRWNAERKWNQVVYQLPND